jgi:hypothetical protein
MADSELTRIVTASGCTVRVIDGDAFPAVVEQHGEGVMLTLDMDQDYDHRHAEVWLDESSIDAVIAGLTKHKEMFI